MAREWRTRIGGQTTHAPERAVAYRQLGGTERFLTPWSSKFRFVSTDWTRDGGAVLGLFGLLGSGSQPTSVALWSTSNPKAEQPERILLSSPAGAQIWCATLSPDARWVFLLCSGSALSRHCNWLSRGPGRLPNNGSAWPRLTNGLTSRGGDPTARRSSSSRRDRHRVSICGVRDSIQNGASRLASRWR